MPAARSGTAKKLRCWRSGTVDRFDREFDRAVSALDVDVVAHASLGRPAVGHEADRGGAAQRLRELVDLHGALLSLDGDFDLRVVEVERRALDGPPHRVDLRLTEGIHRDRAGR